MDCRMGFGGRLSRLACYTEDPAARARSPAGARPGPSVQSLTDPAAPVTEELPNALRAVLKSLR